MSSRAVPIGTLETPPGEVAANALARMAPVRRWPMYLVLRDGQWLLGREHSRFVGEAECGNGRIVARISSATAADEIVRLVEAAA